MPTSQVRSPSPVSCQKGTEVSPVFEQDAADVRVTKVSSPSSGLALIQLTHAFPLQDSLRFKNKLSPFEGFSLRGRVSRTIVRGQTVFKEGRLVGNPTGQKI